jgi:hypothetical protein
MKKLYVSISGTILVASGVIGAWLNIDTPSWLPGLMAPFAPPASPLEFICPAIATSPQGFPLNTNHYGSCGLSSSPVAFWLNWAIVAVVAASGLALVWWSRRAKT